MGSRIIRDPEAFSTTPAQAKPSAHGWTKRLLKPREGAIKTPCKGCGIDMYIPPSKVGQRAYCTIECKSASAANKRNAGHWGDRLFEPRQGTVEKECGFCGRLMHLPKSKTKRNFCSMSCRSSESQRQLTKSCQSCGCTFVGGSLKQKYCSQKCNAKESQLSSPQNLQKAQEGKRRAIAEGRCSFPLGPENKQWKGGPNALRRRQTASGKTAEWTRRYRRKNPDRVRCYARKRQHRKIGRLPYGSLVLLRNIQKDRCAICSRKLHGKGHLDHIHPLARGGDHKPDNLQFLCAPCNLSKSDKDPIDYMRSIGRLL